MGGGIRGGRSSYAGGSLSYTSNTLDTYIPKKKVFISYSMRNKAQVELLRQQAKDNRYNLDFIDTSLKYPVRNRSWKPVVGAKIEESDTVICMIGEDTHSRNAVSWEIEQAYKHNIPVIPIMIHQDKKLKLPKPIKDHNEPTISWDLEDIQYEINAAS